jgi:hypothetical protein
LNSELQCPLSGKYLLNIACSLLRADFYWTLITGNLPPAGFYWTCLVSTHVSLKGSACH